MKANIAKKLIVPVAVVAAVSLCLAGCKEEKKGSEHPEHPSKEDAAKEHPSEHPTDGDGSESK